MAFRVSNRKALLALQKLALIGDELPGIAQIVEAEALGMAIVAAQANIYSTAPGAYRRTGEYLRSLQAEARATQGAIRVRVSSDSDYATGIEYGRDGTPPDSLVARALAQPNMNAPLTLGRSGQAWWIAGPVLTSAQVYAARRMRQLILKRVLASWR